MFLSMYIYSKNQSFYTAYKTYCKVCSKWQEEAELFSSSTNVITIQSTETLLNWCLLYSRLSAMLHVWPVVVCPTVKCVVCVKSLCYMTVTVILLGLRNTSLMH